jgi:hypothetical protein
MNQGASDGAEQDDELDAFIPSNFTNIWYLVLGAATRNSFLFQNSHENPVGVYHRAGKISNPYAFESQARADFKLLNSDDFPLGIVLSQLERD